MLVQTRTEKRLFLRILGIPRSAPFLPCASLRYKLPTDSIRFRKQRDCFGLASGTGVIVAESFVDDAFEVSLVVCFSSFIFSSVPTHPVVAFCCLSFFTLFQCTSSSGCGLVVSLPSDSPCVAAHPVVAWLSLFPQTLRVLQLIQLWPGCLSSLRLFQCTSSSSCGLVVSLPSDSPCVPGYPIVACFSSSRLVQCSSSCTCGLPLFPQNSSSVLARSLVAWLPLFPQTVPVFQVIRVWLPSRLSDSVLVLFLSGCGLFLFPLLPLTLPCCALPLFPLPLHAFCFHTGCVLPLFPLILHAFCFTQVVACLSSKHSVSLRL